MANQIRPPHGCECGHSHGVYSTMSITCSECGVANLHCGFNRRPACRRNLNRHRGIRKRRLPASCLACDAAKLWLRMAPCDERPDVSPSDCTHYKYKSRDPCVNEFLEHLRCALLPENCTINLRELRLAAKQMDHWKRKVMAELGFSP